MCACVYVTKWQGKFEKKKMNHIRIGFEDEPRAMSIKPDINVIRIPTNLK